MPEIQPGDWVVQVHASVVGLDVEDRVYRVEERNPDLPLLIKLQGFPHFVGAWRFRLANDDEIEGEE